MAVLLRAHRDTAKVRHSIAQLEGGTAYDLYILAHEEPGKGMDFGTVPKISYNRESFRELGFQLEEDAHLLQHCADLRFCLAHSRLPGYDWYVFVGPDVLIRPAQPRYFDQLAARLSERPEGLELAAVKLCIGDPGWERHAAAAAVYDRVLRISIAMVALSSRALSVLLAERRREQERAQAADPDKLMFCEAFVPSALAAAALHLTDVNDLLPGSYADQTFASGPPQAMGRLSMEAPPYLAQPVVDDRDALRSRTGLYADEQPPWTRPAGGQTWPSPGPTPDGDFGRPEGPMRVCAITNVLNEFFNLPIWLDYYGRELGPENCIVVDRGSDWLPPMPRQSLIQTHRHPLDDGKRARTMSSLANTMLDYYDVVIYTDCDELLIPDPGMYSGLMDFFTRTDSRAYTAAGIDLVHKLDVEDPLDLSRPILSQRSYGAFNSWMCKTLASRDPIRWGGGFHSSSAPPAFNGLYLFHTAMVDCGERLKRAAQLRRFEVRSPELASYHRLPPLFTLNVLLESTDLEVRDFDQEVPVLLDQALQSARRMEDGLYYVTEEVRPRYLLQIPERFGSRA